MPEAWIDGAPAELSTAAAVAARLLNASRQPLIAGLGADVAGARAAITLAQRVGAAIDHMNADGLLRDLDAMREAGVMLTTANETRLRADAVLLVGPGASELVSELQRNRSGAMSEPAGGATVKRRLFWLCPGRDSSPFGNIAVVDHKARDLPALLAALRARVSGHRVGPSVVPARILDEVADALKAARFGVAVWSAADLDQLTLEMLCGIVNDLNAITRFSGLPLAPGDNAAGVLQVCGWMTGFPMRTGFGRSYPDHDPWQYRAVRLVESGEADCVLWISAYRAAVPEWSEGPPVIALAPGDAKFRNAPRVHIAVGAPGRDHAAVEHHAMAGTLAAVAATQPSAALPVADAIASITAHLLDGPPPC